MCIEKIIHGKQCTIIWHVDDQDDLKMEKEVLEGQINKLYKKSKRKRFDHHMWKCTRIPRDYDRQQVKVKVKMAIYKDKEKLLKELRQRQAICLW